MLVRPKYDVASVLEREMECHDCKWYGLVERKRTFLPSI